MDSMFRCLFFCVIFKMLSAKLNLPQKLADINDFNQMKSAMINEILIKELSTPEKCHMANRIMTMHDLYFHIKSEEWSVLANDLQVPFQHCFKTNNIDNDIFGGRIEMSITFPNLYIIGDFKCTEQAKSAINWKIERYDYKLRLELIDLSGSGICFTQWTETNYKILDCDLKFVKPEGGNDSKMVIVNAEGGSDPSLSWYLKSDEFKKMMIERTWRSLTEDLNENIRDTINNLLTRENVAKFLRDPEVFQKYKNYVIESTESANEFVDGIMGSVKKMLNEKYHDKIKIPNITESFQKKILFITWRGSFTANQGTCRGLASVTRSGDTAFASDNASQTHFFGNLKFEQLDLHYDYYKAEFMKIGPTGTLSTKLRPIRLHIHPMVNWETKKIYLEDFKVEDVGELVVEVTGLGLLNWLVSKIATWVVGLTRDKVLDDLQKKYDAYIKSILSGYTIDDITSGKAFE